jgi:hypothetical protein
VDAGADGQQSEHDCAERVDRWRRRGEAEDFVDAGADGKPSEHECAERVDRVVSGADGHEECGTRAPGEGAGGKRRATRSSRKKSTLGVRRE